MGSGTARQERQERRLRWVGWALLSIVVGCHEPTNIRRVEATALIEPEILDFGELPVGEWAEREVRITNTSLVPFRAIDALKLHDNPSFHVEMVEHPEHGNRLMPDEVMKVKIRFHPLAEGELAENFTVRTDADVRAESAIDVRGFGTPTPVRLSSDAIDFDVLEVDSSRSLIVTVTNPVDIPLSIRVLRDGAPGELPFSHDIVDIPPFATAQVSTKYFPKVVGNDDARLEVRACEKCTPAVVKLKGESVASAFVFEPAPILFEDVPVHETSDSLSRARNITWRPVQISGLRTSDQAFLTLSDPGGVTVGSKETLDVPMRFAARTSGPSTGTLWVDYRSDKDRNGEVALDATGGRPTLAYAPTSIDFGEIPVGGKVERVVRLTNAGTKGNLHFEGLQASGPGAMQFNAGEPRRGTQRFPWSGGAWPNVTADKLPIAPGADYLDVPLQFEPSAAGSFQATITILSDDIFNPERTVVVTGRARASGPCSFRVLPTTALDFGNVPMGWGAVLGFRFENTGTEECAVKNIRLSQTANGAFFMPGGELVGGVVTQDDSFAAQVAFRPNVEGAVTGELVLEVSDPTTPRVTVPLRGFSGATCLVATPNYLDFGAVRYDCEPTPRRTLVSNQCEVPIAVGGLTVGEGTSNQFSVVAQPQFPLTLAPGQGFELEATYSREVHGQHYSPLYVNGTGEAAPLLIPMLGETNHEGIYTDRFTQGADNQLDLLFVIANTTTSDTYQRRLQGAIPRLLSVARERGVELRVGVTTTGLVTRGTTCPGGANGGEAGRLFPVDGSRTRIISGTSANAESLIRDNLRVGLCHNLQQGLETMRQALSAPLITNQDDSRTPQPNDGNLGFLRPAARLAVVMLADEDDHSGFDPESYVQFLQTLKGTGGSHRSALHAIVPTDSSCTTAGPAGPRISSVAKATGGQVLSVCRSDYSDLLDALVTRAAGPQEDFTLTAVPADPGSLTVRVDGQTASGWTYDAEDNAVMFGGGSVPQPGQRVEVRYRSVCGSPPPPKE